MSVTTMPDLKTLLHPYRFTASDKQRLARLLAHAYLTAKYNAYQRAAQTVASYVRVRSPWKPGHHDAQQALSWATKQVESIAATYEDLLEHEAERLLGTQERAFGDFLGKVVSGIGDWFRGFWPWKSEQIANATEGQGEYDGTMEFVEDLQGEDIEFVDDSVQDLSMLMIEVYPAESSSDFCKNWAGQRFPLADADSVPQFPSHPNCIHKVRIVTIE